MASLMPEIEAPVSLWLYRSKRRHAGVIDAALTRTPARR